MILSDTNVEFERLKDKVEKISFTIRKHRWKDKDLQVGIGHFNNQDLKDDLAVANNKSRRLFESVKALYSEVTSINNDIKYKLKKKLQDLQSHGDDKIGGAEENVSQLRGNIKRADSLLDDLTAANNMRKIEIKIANSSLSEKLQLLKDQIQRAKHAAEGVKIAMQPSVNKNCFRSYHIPNLSPSTTTNLMATVALIPKNNKDFIIFHLASSTNVDFIKLEVINKQIKFSWNLGDDTAFIIHPLKLEVNNDLNMENYKVWYKIDVKRVWNVVKLWVYKIVSKLSYDNIYSEILPVTNSSNPSYGILDVKTGDLAWIGSVGNQQYGNTGLAGSLQKLYYDDKSIGLWNFQSQPEENSCAGDSVDNEEFKEFEQNMYYWNGAGYSVLQRTDRLYNKNQFSILLAFKTFDENALLFLAVDEVNNRSVSLQLRDGRIVFKIHYAGESRLEINTTEKYNTGKVVTVQAVRGFMKRQVENGSLKVDDSVQLGSPNPPVVSSNSLPDLSNSDFMIGGIQPLWKPPSFLGILPPPFLGCLGSIVIDSEGFNPIETSTFHGVERSCSKKPLTSVGFYGDGFLELPSHTLRKKTNFGIMFRTLQPKAFLLLSAPHEYYLKNYDINYYTTESEYDSFEPKIKSEGYYSLALVDGKIHLLMDAGKGSLKLISNTTVLNDGHFHAVSVIKNGRKIELYVDDRLQAKDILPHGSVVIHSKPQFIENNITGGLFIGGIPSHLNETEITNQHIGSTLPIRGAIKDIVFEDQIVSLENVVQMHHAHIGRLGPTMGEETEIRANLYNTQEADTNSVLKGCRKVYSYSVEPGAVKFGDKPNSYAQVQFIGRNIWHRNLSIKFDFRTFYPNGLLLVSLGNKETHHHAIAMYLREGKVTLLIKGNKKREKSVQIQINDGLWHHVQLTIYNKKILLTVDLHDVTMRMPKKLSINNMFYVGGLPKKSSLFNIPRQVSKIEGLKGCIRKMSVDNKPEDLVKDSTLHQNVGQCFPTVEKGSYFPGDAYAIYNQRFEIGEYLELNLEFRTVETNGVLLSVAQTNANSPALSLELYNAKIVMSVLTTSGRRFNVQTSLPSKYGLCDNSWHNISALFSNDGLTIRVDQQPEKSDIGLSGILEHTTPPSINQLIRYAPLYIGGLPDGAPTGTLITKDNFKGCIRHISIQSQIKDWTDMDHLHNLLLNSCPIQ